jgi:hypothetical protein
MSATAAEVARRLEAGCRVGPRAAPTLIAGLCADKVEYRHVPELPSDGVVDGARLAESTSSEAAAIGRAISKQGYNDIEVSIDGGQVRVAARGVLDDRGSE